MNKRKALETRAEFLKTNPPGTLRSFRRRLRAQSRRPMVAKDAKPFPPRGDRAQVVVRNHGSHGFRIAQIGKALELDRAGLGKNKIALRLGVSHRTVAALFMEGMGEGRMHPREKKEAATA